MANPFEEFGGTQEVGPATAPSDPFAEFGGTKETTTTNPFAEFGGQSEVAESTPELKRYYEIKQQEIPQYGIGDLLTPGGREARGGVLMSKSVPKTDVAAIAAGNKLDAEKSKLLETLAPLWLAAPPPEEMTLQEWGLTALGRLGYAAADIPQFLAKKAFFQDENFRNALDDLRELGEGRMGAAEWAAWNIGPAIVTAGGTTAAKEAVKAVPKTLPEIVGKSAVFGGVQGVAGSREGQEVETGLQSAALGGAVGLGGATIGKAWHKLVGKKGPAPDVPRDKGEEMALDYAKNNEADITAMTDAAYEKVKRSEEVVEDIALRGKEMTETDVKVILEEQLSPETIRLSRESGLDDAAIAEQYIADRKAAFAEKIKEENPAFRQEPVIKEGTGGIVEAMRPAKVDEVITAARRLGDERVSLDWKRQAKERLFDSQVQLHGPMVRGDETPGLTNILNGFGDRQFGIKVIDEKNGSDVMIPFLHLNTNMNLLTFAKSMFWKGSAKDGIGGIKSLYKSARKNRLVKDITDDEGGEIWTKAMEGRIDELTPEQRQVLTQAQDHINQVRDYANTKQHADIPALNIPKLDDYILPQVMVRPVDYVIKMQRQLGKLADAGIDLSKIDNKQFFELSRSNADVRDFVRGVTIVSDKKKFQNGIELLREYKSITGRGAANPKLQAVTSAAMPRREAIPTFLLEKNILRLVDRYTNNTLKSLYLREPLAEMRSKANMLEKAGAKTDAEYVRRIIGDALGIRASSMARVGNVARMALAASLDRGLSRVITDPDKRARAVKFGSSLAELAANIQYNIYPNVLGTSPRALVAQLTQTMFKTAPELGGTYGYRSAMQAYMKSILGLSGGRQELVNKMRSYGLEPRSFTRENVDQVADGIQGSAVYRLPANVIRGAAEGVMNVYQYLDTLNRASMVDMAERLVRDVAAKDKAAFAVVEKMPLSIKRSIIKNKGNPEAQTKVIAQYLNSATQFNYNKVSMSELGAIVGPLFSVFTKWPLATAGDIAADFRTKGLSGGALRAAEKYGTVFLLAQAADSLLYASLTGDWEFSPSDRDFKEAGPRAQAMVGRGGFTTMAPILSVAPLIPGMEDKSLITPPILDTVVKGIIKPALEGDDEKLKAGATKALTTFAPGGFIYNLLMTTAPRVIANEPEW